MQIWTPQWTIQAPRVNSRFVSSYGGVFEGLAEERWPVCAECGIIMTPLLRLAAGPWIPRIPDGHVLLVFKCEGEDGCSFWDPDDLANRCLLVPESDLDSEVALPANVADGTTIILPRLWVGEWVPSDDGLTAEQADAIDDPDQYWDLPEALQMSHGYRSEKLTKAGGAPYWTGNGPRSEPPRPRQLLFQIDNWIIVNDKPEEIANYLADTDPGVTFRGNTITAANFMSDGIAFIFDVTPDEPVPTLKLAINR